MKKLIMCSIILLSGINTTKAEIWTTLDYPGASETWITEIDGSISVGTYHINGVFHGFSYDGTAWSTIDYPDVEARTSVGDIEGNKMVGWYMINPSKDYHGFVYDGSNWSTIDKPEAISTLITSIDGINLAGYYTDYLDNAHGFIFDELTWIDIDIAGATATYIDGIEGDNVFGKYIDAVGSHGFLYNIVSEIAVTIDKPDGTNTNIRDIDGTKLVGSYSDTSGDHGFLYDGTTWTSFDMPGAIHTYIYSISGNNLAGSYIDSEDMFHGFTYTIPEPYTLFLLALGGLVLRRSN